MRKNSWTTFATFPAINKIKLTCLFSFFVCLFVFVCFLLLFFVCFFFLVLSNLHIRGFKTGYFDKNKNGTENKFSLGFLTCCIGLSLCEHAKIEFVKKVHLRGFLNEPTVHSV